MAITDPVAVSAIQNLSAATSATATITGGASGDTVIVAIGTRGGSALTFSTATSGWTKQGQGQQGTASTLAVFTAAWGASNPAITWGGASLNGWIQVIILRGASAFRAPVFNSGTTATHTASSDTGTVRGTWRLLIAATVGATAYTNLPPGFEVWRNAFGGGGTTATREECLFAACGNMHEAATGTRTFTGAAASWVTCTLLVEPTTPTETGMIRCGSATGTGGTSATATLDGTHVSGTVTGTCIINNASIYSAGTNTVTGVTAAGTAMTAGPTQQSANAYDAIHYLPNRTAANGTNVSVVTSRSGNDSISVFVAEYGGLDTTSPLDASGASTNTGTAVSTTTSAAPSAGTRLAIHNMGNGNNGTGVTQDANYLVRFVYILGSTGQTPLVVQGREFTANGSSNETATMTLATSAQWAAVLAIFKVASSGVNANAGLQSETESQFALSGQGGASTTLNLQALTETLLALTATGAASAPVGLLGLTSSQLATSAVGGANGAAALQAEVVSPLAPTVQAGAVVPVSMQAEAVTNFAATGVIATLASVGLLSETESQFALSVIGGASPPVSLGLESLSTLAVTVQAGAVAPVNLQALVESLFGVSVIWGAAAPVNLKTMAEPYPLVYLQPWVDAIGEAMVPVNRITETLSTLALTGQGGAAASVGLNVETLTPSALSVIAAALAPVARQALIITNLPADVNAPGGVSALVSLQVMTETPQVVTVQAGSLVTLALQNASLTALGLLASGGASATLTMQSLFETPLGLVASGGASGAVARLTETESGLTIASVIGGALAGAGLQGLLITPKALASVLGGAQVGVSRQDLLMALFAAAVGGILRAPNFYHRSSGLLFIPLPTSAIIDLKSRSQGSYPTGTSGQWAGGPHQSQGEYEP